MLIIKGLMDLLLISNNHGYLVKLAEGLGSKSNL